MTSFVPELTQACSVILRQAANKKILPFNVHIEQVDPLRPQIVWWDIHDPYNEQLKIAVDLLIKPSWFGNTLDILHIDGRVPWITENYLISKRNWPQFRQNTRGYLWSHHTQPEDDLVNARLKWHLRHWKEDVLVGSAIRYIESMAWPELLKLRTLDEVLYLTRRVQHDTDLKNRTLLSQAWSRIAVSDTLDSGSWIRPYHNADLLDDGYLMGWSEQNNQRVHVMSLLANRWMLHTHDVWALTTNGEFKLQSQSEPSAHVNEKFSTAPLPHVLVNYGQASLPMRFQTFSLSDGKAELDSLAQSIQASKLNVTMDDLWYTQTQTMRRLIPNMKLFGSTQLSQIKNCTDLFLQYAESTSDMRLRDIATSWSVQNTMSECVPNSFDQWKQCANTAFGILEVSKEPSLSLPSNMHEYTEKT